MKPVLRVLIVEDSEFDAQMITSLIRKSGYEVVAERVETGESMTKALRDKPWDLILSDYNLPQFSAPEALKSLQESQLDLPFIIISCGIGEKTNIPRIIETVGRRKDGREIVIEISFSHMEMHGERRHVAFVRDITARKRAERELRENAEQFQVAREIQQRLFPKSATALEGFDIAGVTYPAEAT